VIIEKLWPSAEYYADQNDRIYKGNPRTISGSLRQSGLLIKQFADMRDALGTHLARQVIELVEPYFKELSSINDDDHAKAGELAFNIVEQVKEILNRNSVAARDHRGAVLMQFGYFDFDVTDKLRELINMHARRSRYLY
jgi:hypothetical protein